ncbi:MAG TPA: ABC transporter permease [Candidatus Dormibacteraeota bacterium]
MSDGGAGVPGGGKADQGHGRPGANVVRVARGNLDVIVLVIFLVGMLRLPQGVIARGIVQGAAYSLQALAVVLVFRSNRVINFAQASFGATAAVLFAILVGKLQFLHLLEPLCPPCFSGAVASPPSWAIAANFWASAAVALALSGLLAYLAYTVVLARLRSAPRLVLTVATIAVAQLLAGLATEIPQLFITRTAGGEVETATAYLGKVAIPVDMTWNIGGTLFHATEVLTVAAAALVGVALTAFFLWSRAGIAIRASADNAARAQTLGINVGSQTALVWLVAGLLSGLGAILSATGGGVDATTALSTGGLTRILLVALAARFANLPLTVLAAVALGVGEQGFFASFNAPTLFEGLLVVAIAAFLLLQDRGASRALAEVRESWLAARELRGVPRELQHIPVVQNYRRWGTGLGLVALLAYPFVMSPSQVTLGGVVIVYAIIGVSLLVLTGWAGQISLGHFGFAAIGGYVAAVLAGNYGMPFPLCLLAGAVAGGVAAVAVGLPALRLTGLNLAVVTLALALTVSDVLLNRSYLGGILPQGLDRPLFLGIDLNDDRAFFYLALLVLAAVVAVTMAMRRSRTARALIACRDNEEAAQSLGINLFRTRLTAFAISGSMAALAGGLLVFQERGLQPLDFSPQVSVGIFLLVVIGGLGSIAGPVLGAVYTGLALAIPGQVGGLMATGGGVLFLLLVAPGGLAQLVFGLRDAFLRRVAVRYRVPVPSLLGDRALSEDAPVPILPNMRPGGGTAFVPRRYQLDPSSEPAPDG